jgi:hypothetical protein
MKSQYSDEMINAFVDDELDSRDRENIKMAMEADAELAEKIASVCALKKSLKQSYADSASIHYRSGHDSQAGRFVGWQHGVAALLLLCIGTAFGWYGHSTATQNALVAGSLEGLQLTPVNMQQPNKIILHVASSEGNKLEKTLQQVEYIIDQYQRSNLSYEVEVIANSAGIDLLREDVSPYVDRISSIMRAHDNISFVACANALDKLRSEGIEPKIIANAHTEGTAIEQIVKRLQQGWIYVKV